MPLELLIECSASYTIGGISRAPERPNLANDIVGKDARLLICDCFIFQASPAEVQKISDAMLLDLYQTWADKVRDADFTRLPRLGHMIK